MATKVSSPPTEAPPRPVGREPELAPLFRQLAQDSSALIRQEIALAKAEVRQSVRQTTNGVLKLAIAGGLAAAGGLVLTAFLVILVGQLLGNYWASALIVGAVYLLIGALFGFAGMRRLRALQGPDATIATLKEDRDWARAEMQELKRDLRG